MKNLDLKDIQLGIPSEYEFACINENKNYTEFEEFKNISIFLRDFLCNSDFIKNNVNMDDIMQVKFINYGNTEMVYVLRVNQKMYTLLVNQPDLQYGRVKKEYDNLRMFGKNHPKTIVTPISYYTNSKMKKELFVTPYFVQARCISNLDGKWGEYVPEPEYHFKNFSKEEESIIKPSIIANLVRLYDSKNNIGIANSQMRSGDFILEKELDNEKLNFENVMNRMKLISVRDTINMPFKEYIETIKKEFLNPTDDKNKNIINTKMDVPFSKEEIEKGIALGIKTKEKEENEEER